MPQKKPTSKYSNGITINKELIKSKKFILSSLAILLVVSLYTKIIQFDWIDNGFQVTYHSDKKERALNALSEIKVAASEQADKVSN